MVNLWSRKVLIIVSLAWCSQCDQVPINDVEEVGERKNNQEDHQHEVHAVRDGLLDQLHVVGKGREQTHPVEHLDPHKEGCETAISSHLCSWEMFILTDTIDCSHN